VKPAGSRKADRPQTRANAGLRLRALLSDAGLSAMQTAKLFQVTPRTVHNWRSGATKPPGAVLRVLRLMAGRELGVPGWEGWRMHSGKLWTPEGHRIEPGDGAWWSLLVRQARGFRTLYRQLCQMRQLGYSEAASETGQRPEGAPLAGMGPDAGRAICARSPMVITGITPENRYHAGAIMTPWPSISDSLQPWKPTPALDANGSESASTLSSAWPSTGTFDASRPPQSPHSPLGMLEQPNALPSPRRSSSSLPPSQSSRGAGAPSLRSVGRGPRLILIPSQSLAPSPLPRIASGWLSGICAIPPIPGHLDAPEVQR
jgi:DNA-binding transcriptional regulator YiaG